MFGPSLPVCKLPCALQDHIHPQILPGKLARVFQGKDFDLFPVNEDGFFLSFNISHEFPVNRIVL